MTDIVERLRQSVTKGHEPTDELAIEAADEIERLRTLFTEAQNRQGFAEVECERLRVALNAVRIVLKNRDQTEQEAKLLIIIRAALGDGHD